MINKKQLTALLSILKRTEDSINSIAKYEAVTAFSVDNAGSGQLYGEVVLSIHNREFRQCIQMGKQGRLIMKAFNSEQSYLYMLGLFLEMVKDSGYEKRENE